MIVIYDGYCNLCSGTVRFIHKRDPGGVFYFVPAQSEEGERLMRLYGFDPGQLISVIVIEDSMAYSQSEAFFKIIRQFPWYWRALLLFRTIPEKLRDKLYDFIARNRYKIFGTSETCSLPPGRNADSKPGDSET